MIHREDPEGSQALLAANFSEFEQVIPIRFASGMKEVHVPALQGRFYTKRDAKI